MDQSTGQAAVWPAGAEPSRARHGYTVSHDVYAAAAKVVGWKVTVTAGNASVYAGTPIGFTRSVGVAVGGSELHRADAQRGCGGQFAERFGVPVHAHPEHAAHPGTDQRQPHRRQPTDRLSADWSADRFVGGGDVELHGYAVPVG